MPTARAPWTSDDSWSPTWTGSCASTPARDRAARNMAGSGFAAPTSADGDGEVEQPGKAELADELVAACVHVGDEARQQASIAQGPEGWRRVREGCEPMGYLLYAAPYLACGLEGDLDAAAPYHAPLVLLEDGGPLDGCPTPDVMSGVFAAQVGVGVRIAPEDALRGQGDTEVRRRPGTGPRTGPARIRLWCRTGRRRRLLASAGHLLSTAISSVGLTWFPHPS